MWNGKGWLIWLLLFLSLWGDTRSVDLNHSADQNNSKATQALKAARTKQAELQASLRAIDRRLNEESVWQKVYTNHLVYLKIAQEIKVLQRKMSHYKRKGRRRYRKKIDDLNTKLHHLQERLKLLQEYAQNPFKQLIKPLDIPPSPSVENPIAVIGAFSYLKQIKEELVRFEKEVEDLSYFIDLLQKKVALLQALQASLQQGEDHQAITIELAKSRQELQDAQEALTFHKTALFVNRKKIDEVTLRLSRAIKEQAKKAGAIGVAIGVLLLLVLLLKWLIRRTVTDNERFYMANKILNFTFVFISIIIILLAYIENVTYLVTVLGFASAGIAIAMKDWFMSMLGWLVIILGGSIHVGDRIRVDKDGKMYVGDVLDISLLRMTLLEDITLTTYKHNRRAGRIIFIPNNYIFTDMIANYTHATLKTVWDGIDMTITFDSNHKKAAHIARETAKKYAKGYTDITRKQLNRLLARYSLKNTNVEPRVYTFAEEYGVRVSVWYLTNAYATLTLRSTISTEILDRFMEEEDIHIAYPTQHFYIDRASQATPRAKEKEA